MSRIDAARTCAQRALRGGLAVALGAAGGLAVLTVPLTMAGASSPTVAAPVATYTPGTAQLAEIKAAATCTTTPTAYDQARTSCPPWNESQGTPSATPLYKTTARGQTVTYVFPSYLPGGPTAGTATAGTAEPNVAVYAGHTSKKVNGTKPYAAGVVGTPGPDDGYCGAGTNSAETARTRKPLRQPAGTTLPLAPDYFPHVVKTTSAHRLIGYFDYRPKTTDEALLVATATLTGKTWTYRGEALEQNPTYCPTGDIDDTGEGHSATLFTLTVGGTKESFLYTLERATGDSKGVGMIVHRFSTKPTASTPIPGLPQKEETGIDPDAFVPTGSAPVTVGSSTSSTIPLTTLGTPGSAEQLVSGGFVDLTDGTTVTKTFTCTVTTSTTTLTGCKTIKSTTTVQVTAGALIEQVIGFVKTQVTVPQGPNPATDETTAVSGEVNVHVAKTKAGTTAGFTDPVTGAYYTAITPERAFVNGVATYCNNAKITEMKGCTTGQGSTTTLIAAKGDPITSAPIVPKTAYTTAGGDGMTKGLVAPDGIEGTLKSFPTTNGFSLSGKTLVMYLQKETTYFIAGKTKATVTFKSSATFAFTFAAGTYEATDMPSVVSTNNPVTVTLDVTGADTTFAKVTCKALSRSGTTVTLSKCRATTSRFTGKSAKATWEVGAPGVATVPASILHLTGEGKTTTAKGRFAKNNEDLSVLRVAYTTNGVTFSDATLENTGIISGNKYTAAHGRSTAESGTSYKDINDTAQTTEPMTGSTIDLNKYAAAGHTDTTELRWVGSAGTLITNGGHAGLFLSGAWAGDGDSDAFNQIFYTQSTNGFTWSVPTLVESTDYTFSASQKQETQIAHTGNTGQTGHNQTYTRLGISAYYSGRAYGPTVVQHTGKLTMVFAGYRLAKPVSLTVGTSYGTGYGGKPKYTIGAKTPALYRSILTVNLSSETETTVTATPSSAVAGQTVTLSATVSVPGDTTAVPTGAVTFSDATGALCSATLDEATPDVASCGYAFSKVGSDSVSASYAGDAGDTPSKTTTPVTVTVGRVQTATTIDVTPHTAVTGQAITLKATVSALAPGVGTPTGTVTFSDATGTLCSATLDDATPDVASCDVTFSGNRTTEITASYAGTTLFATSQSVAAPVMIGTAQTSTTVTSSGDPSVTGQPVTFTATVTPTAPGGGTPTGAVTFSLLGKASKKSSPPVSVICTGGDTKTLTAGSATCSLPGGLAATESPVTVVATYDGSTAYAQSPPSQSLAQTVDKDASTVTVRANEASPVTGQAVSFSASVAAAAPGAGQPAGKFTWKVVDGRGGTVTCTPSGAEKATCTVARRALTVAGGPYTATATYGGNGDFAAGSGALQLTVSQGDSSTAISSFHAPSAHKSGSVTASVTAVAPAYGTPTGTVTFTLSSSGHEINCVGGDTVSLGKQRATCTIPAGTSSTAPYTVTATYNGDTNFLGSSASLAVNT